MPKSRFGGISMLTPDDVYHDRAPETPAQRQRILEAAARTAQPEPIVRGIPTQPSSRRGLDQPTSRADDRRNGSLKRKGGGFEFLQR